MEKAQWSPINSEPTSAGISPGGPTAKKQHPGLTRLPINFSNRTPIRPKKQYAESPRHIVERSPVVNNPTLNADLPASEVESRSSKPQETGLVSNTAVNQTSSSTPFAMMLPDERTSEKRVESKRHEMGSNGHHTTTAPSSRTGTQTPKGDHQPGMSLTTKRMQAQKPSPIQTAKDPVYPAKTITSLGNESTVNETSSNAIKMSEPRQGSAKGTSGPRDTPASLKKDSPNVNAAEPHEMQRKPVQDRPFIDVDEQSSSSSDDDDDDDAVHLPPDVGPQARGTEEAIEEAESAVMDESDQVVRATSLPDDHHIEWLAEAREMYQQNVPPFVTKQKFGVRRMVELPLTGGHQEADKVEVVYRSWDAAHTFASIDVNDKRFIVKVFRGGATPYRPWLGPQTGFAEKPLAFSKQSTSRGPRAWTVVSQGKRVSLPKGWALREEDERDDDYSPASRRKSAQIRRRPRLNYDLNDDEEEIDVDTFPGEPFADFATQVHSERSFVEGEFLVSHPTGDQLLKPNISSPQPPSKLINAVKKSLRLPKEQDDYPRPKQIKRRSIGGQAATTDSGGNKRQKHKADFSSGSEHSVPHKRAKATKAIPHRTWSADAASSKNVSQVSRYEPSALDAPALSPYKQSHTTLRIALVPYPLQSVVQRLRSCMTMATFFNTVIGVSGYKGDMDRIFGVTATFDCKSDDDADKSMVIREEWQDSFDIFLETVDGAESWTKEGGKCGVAIRLLLTEG